MPATHLTSRAIVRLTPQEGEDAVGFLQGLVTNDVTGALPVYAGLLTPQGKTLFDFLVWRDGDDLLLDCEATAAENLVRRLSLYRLRRKIAITVDGALAVWWSLERPSHVERQRLADMGVWGTNASPDPRLNELGWRWLLPPFPSDESGDTSWLAQRLSLGVPEGRAELGDILWLETNAAELNGVSFDKGCYVGQENTARMNWRQKVNRRLVVVSIGDSDEKRRKAAYLELGLAVDHRRAEDIDLATAPEWLRQALAG